jgi:hypothetical protein
VTVERPCGKPLTEANRRNRNMTEDYVITFPSRRPSGAGHD